MATPTRHDLERAAAAYFEELAAEQDQPRHFDEEHFDDDVRFNVDCSRERTRELDSQLRSNLFDGHVHGKVADLARLAGIEASEVTGRMELFALQLAARAEREALQLHIHRLTSPAVRFKAADDLFERQAPQTTAPAGEPQAARSTPLFASSLTLRAAVEAYLRWKKARELSQSQVDELTRALKWLRERFGDDTALDAPAGTWGMQPRILHMLKWLGLTPRMVPASNVVFTRSRTEAALRADKASLLAACWPVHQTVIDALGVHTILCLGSTAGSWVRRQVGANEEFDHFVEVNNRGWRSEAHLAPDGRAVVTVTHPGRADWMNPAADPTPLVYRVMSR